MGNNKKAITSFILGIVSLIGGIKTVYIYEVGPYRWLSEELVLIIYTLIPLVGLILGILGLKSTKKIFAILGIVLSSISLLVTFCLIVLMYLIASGM